VLTKYYYTLIHLRPIQIRYQLWYRIRRSWRKLNGFKYPLSIEKKAYPINLKSFIPKYTSFTNYELTFLNQSQTFTEPNLDWNFKKFGKLWTYNLNYFDFLLQQGMNPDIGKSLIEDFMSKLNNNPTALEPYPIALRCVNWIKFISQNSFSNSQILKFSNSIYAQYQILLDNLEYHLLGNHILEDGFSLLFGAFYFRDEKLYLKAIEIIGLELNEQILADGAHFELSPMYHQIILDRLLDCINLVQNNQRFDDQESLLILMNEKAKRMLQWINCMTFSNGKIPLLNDSATDIAPFTDQLNEYSIRLGLLSDESIRVIRQNSCNLSQSGYRRFNGNKYECIIDIGQIGPSYQPGHAHADTFNFVLNINNQPFIIDPGISTYECNKIRLKERGTASHNTVTIANQNSSGVWSSFRVAHQAKVFQLIENRTTVTAEHNGFRINDTIHQRKWEFQNNEIKVTDYLKGAYTKGKAHYWLAPQLNPKSIGSSIHVENVIITFENAEAVAVLKTKITSGYNKYVDTFKLEVSFNGHLQTILAIN
jgi:hypothetical protein